MIIRVYRYLHVWMRLWKMYALLASESRTQPITSWVENRLLAWVRFLKLVQFQIHPRLNILNVPEWLNVKFNCFLIGQKFKILNILTPLALLYVTFFSTFVTRVNSFTRPTGFLYWASVTNMVSFPVRCKMSRSCRSLQCQLFEKSSLSH